MLPWQTGMERCGKSLLPCLGVTVNMDKMGWVCLGAEQRLQLPLSSSPCRASTCVGWPLDGTDKVLPLTVGRVTQTHSEGRRRTWGEGLSPVWTGPPEIILIMKWQ